MFAFVQELNLIMDIPIKSSYSHTEIIRVYTSLYTTLKTRGFASIFQKCDNRGPDTFTTFIHKTISNSNLPLIMITAQTQSKYRLTLLITILSPAYQVCNSPSPFTYGATSYNLLSSP